MKVYCGGICFVIFNNEILCVENSILAVNRIYLPLKIAIIVFQKFTSLFLMRNIQISNSECKNMVFLSFELCDRNDENAKCEFIKLLKSINVFTLSKLEMNEILSKMNENCQFIIDENEVEPLTAPGLKKFQRSNIESCIICQTQICRKCGLEYKSKLLDHKNYNCGDYKWLLENDSSEAWINRFTRPCPNCYVRIEKVTGD
jgi:hypothetical protein